MQMQADRKAVSNEYVYDVRKVSYYLRCHNTTWLLVLWRPVTSCCVLLCRRNHPDVLLRQTNDWLSWSLLLPHSPPAVAWNGKKKNFFCCCVFMETFSSHAAFKKIFREHTKPCWIQSHNRCRMLFPPIEHLIMYFSCWKCGSHAHISFNITANSFAFSFCNFAQ